MDIEKVASATSVLPRREEVMVGERTLVVKEMTIEPWESLMTRLRETLRIVDLAAPLIRSFGALTKSDGEEYTVKDLFAIVSENAEIVGSLLERAFTVVTEDLPYVACIGLVSEENAEALGVDISDVYETVRKDMTVRQHFKVFEAVVQVNDFRDLLGKYSALWGILLGSAQSSAANGETTPEPAAA